MPGHPLLILTIELEGREFDSRLLLAREAVKRGWQVILGQQWLIRALLPRFAPAVVVVKGVNILHRLIAEEARRAGHRIAAINEEATGQAKPEHLCKETTFENLDAMDVILTHGAFEQDCYEQVFPGIGARCRVTGNGRIDILDRRLTPVWADEVQAIRAAHGPFILINSSFGYINSSYGSPEAFCEVAEAVGAFDRSKPEDREWLADRHVYEERNLEGLMSAAVSLRRRFPDHRIVVRPHPSENPRPWQERLAGDAGVTIIERSAPLPWIEASDLLIHNACTTGIESVLSGNPALSYMPFINSHAEDFLSHRINPMATNEDELIGLVERTLADPGGSVQTALTAHRELLEHHFRNAFTKDSGKRVMAAVESLAQPTRTAGPFAAPDLAVTAAGTARFEQQHLNAAARTAKIDIGYEAFCRQYDRLASLMGDGESPRITHLGPVLFHLEPASIARIA